MADEPGYDTYQRTSTVSLYNPYFEDNRGWDVRTGTAQDGRRGAVHLNVIGGTNTVTKKGEGYGFAYLRHTRALLEGVWLSSVPPGTETVSFDRTCRVTVLGDFGSIQ